MGMRLSARFAAIGIFCFFFDYERGEAKVSYGGRQRPLNLTWKSWRSEPGVTAAPADGDGDNNKSTTVSITINPKYAGFECL